MKDIDSTTRVASHNSHRCIDEDRTLEMAGSRNFSRLEPIYLDNNASTAQLSETWEAMKPFLAGVHGNPASSHSFGRKARQALENARDSMAEILGAYPDEVIFTSGATEANNLAVFGLAGDTPGRVVTHCIEHPSVSEPIAQLEKKGFVVDRLPVDETGAVRVAALSQRIAADIRLAAFMLANHETGTMQPIAELTKTLGPKVAFHCDAAQAAGKVPIHFHDLGATTLSISAHKFHGPKGVGALLVSRGSQLRPRAWGGHQQRGLRPGTEPVALVVGMAIALEAAHRDESARHEHVVRLRRQFLEILRSSAAPVVLNGPDEEPLRGVPHTINISFPGCRSDSLLMNLDLAGVACSTGSACSSGSLLPSPVLQAMGVPDEVLHSAMRFSLAFQLTVEEIEEAARRIAEVVRRLRRTDE